MSLDSATARRLALALAAALAAAIAIGVLGGEDAPAKASCPSGPRVAPIVHRGTNLAPPGRSKPVPLVIGLHGRGNNPSYLERQTGLDQVADRHGFVVVYLGSQTPTSPAWALCNMPSNLAYISSEITQLTGSQHIDPSRVYVTGFSAGASMTFRVGCTLSSQVAAIAPVSGWMQNGEACQVARPESMMLIIGTNDAAPVNGTASLLSVSAVASLWQGLDGCVHSPPATTTVGAVSESTWSRCDDSSGLAEYIIKGGTHAWPSGGASADRGLNASESVWAFFSAHPAGSATAPSVDLNSVRARHSKARRWVRIAMSLNENAVVLKAALTYHSRRVADHVFDLSRGNKAAILSVPKKGPGGRYKLTLTFRDRYGRRMTVVHMVGITKQPKR